MRISFFLISFVSCLPFLVLSSESSASPLDSDRVATEISNTIMSPYCPGRTLSACPSSKARKLRGEMLSKLDGGVSKEDLYGWLESKYGMEIYGTPQGALGGLIAWLVPIGFVVLGLAVVIFFLSNLLRKSRLEGVQSGGPSAGSVESEDLLEKELQEIVDGRLGS